MANIILISLLIAAAYVSGGNHSSLRERADQSVAGTNKAGSMELVYEATIGSKKIGEFRVQRIHHADSVIFRASSVINTNLGFRLTQDYQLYANYSGGYLVSSFVRNVVNDKVRADTRIRYQNGYYLTDEDGEQKLDHEPVSYSIPHLFFREPNAHPEVFSETFGEYVACEPRENDESSEYLVRTPAGQKVHYFYNGSVCERWEVKMLVFDVRYELQEARNLP